MQEIVLHKEEIHPSLKNSFLIKDHIVINCDNYFTISNGQIDNDILQTFKVCKFWRCPISENMINLSRLKEDIHILKSMSATIYDKKDLLKYCDINNEVIEFIHIIFGMLLYDENIDNSLKYSSLTGGFIIINNILCKKKIIRELLTEQEEEEFIKKHLSIYKIAIFKLVELYHIDRNYGNSIHFNILFNSLTDIYRIFFLNLNTIIYFNEKFIRDDNILEGWNQKFIDKYNQWKSTLPDEMIAYPKTCAVFLSLALRSGNYDNITCNLPSNIQKIFVPDTDENYSWNVNNMISYMHLNMMIKMGGKIFEPDYLKIIQHFLWFLKVDFLDVLFNFPVNILFDNIVLMYASCNSTEKILQNLPNISNINLKVYKERKMMNIDKDFRIKILIIVYNCLLHESFDYRNSCSHIKHAYLKYFYNYWKESVLKNGLDIQNFDQKDMEKMISAKNSFCP